jgi:hypothetical protein
MCHKLLILSSIATLAFALPSGAAENSGASVVPTSNGLRGKVACRGLQNVPVTADAEQALPMQIVTRLSCGEDVAIISDSEGYTVNIRTADGKNGYVARMYLTASPANSANARRTVEAVVDNGIARWQAGAPGTDQFFSGGTLVESLTANDITVQVSLQDTGWKLRASIAIANGSAEQVSFNPAGFTLHELQPRLRSLAYQNPGELAKALTHQVYWTNASATAPASSVYMNAVYKPSAPVAATPNFLASEAQQVQAPVLQARTLDLKDHAAGVVWFERDKNAQQLNLRVFVGDQIFEFPLSFPHHN